MGVAIGDYTNTDKIRGALGFTLSDVSDKYIEDREISEELLISLYGWIPDHKTRYAAWVASATADDDQYKRLLEKYCTYICAFHLSSGLELLATQAITDSKAGAERFSSVKLENLRDRMEGIALSTLTDLATALSLSVSNSSVSIFASVSPSVDPVTRS